MKFFACFGGKSSKPWHRSIWEKILELWDKLVKKVVQWTKLSEDVVRFTLTQLLAFLLILLVYVIIIRRIKVRFVKQLYFIFAGMGMAYYAVKTDCHSFICLSITYLVLLVLSLAVLMTILGLLKKMTKKKDKVDTEVESMGEASMSTMGSGTSSTSKMNFTSVEAASADIHFEDTYTKSVQSMSAEGSGRSKSGLGGSGLSGDESGPPPLPDRGVCQTGPPPPPKGGGGLCVSASASLVGCKPSTSASVCNKPPALPPKSNACAPICAPKIMASKESQTPPLPQEPPSDSSSACVPVQNNASTTSMGRPVEAAEETVVRQRFHYSAPNGNEYVPMEEADKDIQNLICQIHQPISNDPSNSALPPEDSRLKSLDLCIRKVYQRQMD